MDDRDWVYDLCRRRYSADFDFATMEGWFRNVVLPNPLTYFAIRNNSSFIVAYLHAVPWVRDLDCDVVLVCAEPGCIWATIELLRVSIEWAKQRNAKRWIMSSETEIDVEALAKRCGAAENKPRYRLELR